MKFQGNLKITRENQDQYKSLVEVTGSLDVRGEVKLEALTTVGGSLDVYGEAKLDAPALTTVGGSLDVYGEAKLDAPALTTVGGSLYVRGEAKLDAPALTTVGGSLYVRGEVKLEALTTVGGSLYVSGEAKLEALTTVGGSLYVSGEAKLEALTTVGGSLYVYGEAKLEAPALTNHSSDSARAAAKRTLELSFAAHGQILIDGILSWIIGKKQIGEIVAYEVRVVGKSEVSFAVQRGEQFAHGATVEQAIRDLRYKLSDRDTSRFKSWTLETTVSIDDAIQSYRAITGACELGTKHFCDGQDLPDAITVSEVIRTTQGQYGHEAYRTFFELGGEK